MESDEDKDEEDQVLHSGLEYVVKAFEQLKEKSRNTINDLENELTKLSSQLSILTKENNKLKQENNEIQAENQKIKSQNNKLLSSLESNQSKLQMIKKSILEANSFSSINPINTNSANTNINNNINTYNIDNTLNNPVGTGQKHSMPMKQDLFHMYNKKAIYLPASQYIPDNNGNHKKSSNTSPITINNDKYYNIDNKINKIINNLSARDSISKVNNTIGESRLINHPNYDEKIEVKQRTRVSTPAGNRSNLKEKILQGKSAHKSNEKSNRYETINKFLNECNLRLDPLIFEQILSIFESSKKNTISEEECKKKITQLIPNYHSLLQILETVF